MRCSPQWPSCTPGQRSIVYTLSHPRCIRTRGSLIQSGRYETLFQAQFKMSLLPRADCYTPLCRIPHLVAQNHRSTLTRRVLTSRVICQELGGQPHTAPQPLYYACFGPSRLWGGQFDVGSRRNCEQQADVSTSRNGE